MEYDIAIIGGWTCGLHRRRNFGEWIKNYPFREERYRWRLLNEDVSRQKLFILRQDTRQYQKCLQIWYSGDERPKFRLGKDYRPEEQDRLKLTLGVKPGLRVAGVTIVEGGTITGRFGNIRIHCDGKSI